MTVSPRPPAPGDLLLRATSRGLDPRSLVPGSDAVLDLAIEQGHSLPHGVLLDDHLDLDARREVDRVAHDAIASWRGQVDEALTIDGICLSDVWHTELFAEVFLPVARVVAGVRATLESAGAGRLVCEGLDAGLVRALRAELAPIEVTTRSLGPAPRYPSEEAVRPGIAARQPAWQRLARGAVGAAGLPTRARGEVLVVPYLSTVAVLELLAAGEGPRPVLYAAALPRLSLALRVSRRGGWLGLPGHWSRRRARREAIRRLAIAAAATWPEVTTPGVPGLLHERSLDCLAGRALDTTAAVRGLRSLFNRGRLRAVVLPFDHEPQPKTIVRLAQRAGVPVLFVQHGYEPYRVFHTGRLADFAALWSPADARAFPTADSDRVRVLGNPAVGLAGAEPGAHPARPARTQPVAIVLAEHYIRHSAILDRRVTAQHLAAAIEGLRGSGHRWRIVIRPHPSDDVAEFERLAAALGGEGIEVDGASSARELLSQADLCVGALSTMTLEAALWGVRVVMLNLQRIGWSPPLQPDGPVPTAHDAPGLARVIAEVMAAAEPPGASALLEGLGVGPPDPARDVVAWLERIVVGPPGAA